MFDFSQLSFQDILLRLTVLPVVLASIVGLVRFRYLPLNLRYLAGVAWLVLPLEVAQYVIMVRHGNNLFLIPIATAGEVALLTMVYRYTLQSVTFTRVVPWLVGGFTAYVVVDSLFLSDLTWFRPVQQVLESVLVLVLVGLYFRKLLNELVVKSLTREPMFWVSTGLFFYFVVYLQIGLFSNYLLHYSRQLNTNIWMVHSLLFVGLYCCYSLALWMRPQK